MTRDIVALAALACVLGFGARLAADSPEASEPTDWPVLIAKLQRQLYEQPGYGHTREQLAIAYNNYGVTLSDQGEWALAERQFEEAIQLDGKNSQFRRNLSNIYLNQAGEAYRRHAVTEAASAIDKAVALEPDLAPAYFLRGEIEYGRQRLKEAKTAWQRSLELDPAQPELAQRLDQLSHELPVESGYERLSQAYFDLRYEEQLRGPAGFDVRDALLDARRTVGSDFAYWPKHKIVALIYSAASFRKVREETPDWVAGQFDGKIRVRFPEHESDLAAVKQTLFHEYTHALIHDIAQGRCPMWLNEGLAEYEGRTQQARPVERLAKAVQGQQLIPLAELSDHFSMSRSADDVALAYEQSYSLAAYFVRRYGFWRIRRILKAVGDGRPWEAVVKDETRLSLPRLEAAWKAWLPEFLGGG